MATNIKHNPDSKFDHTLDIAGEQWCYIVEAEHDELSLLVFHCVIKIPLFCVSKSAQNGLSMLLRWLYELSLVPTFLDFMQCSTLLLTDQM